MGSLRFPPRRGGGLRFPSRTMDPIETVKTQFADQVLGVYEHAGQKYVHVKRDRILEILKALKEGNGFDCLTDLTAVDRKDA